MKKIPSLLSLALSLPLMSWGATLSGQVLVGVAGTTGYVPIPGVQVTLLSGVGGDAELVDTVLSDDLGNYKFEFNQTGFMQVAVTSIGTFGNFLPVTTVTLIAVNNQDDELTADISFTYLGDDPNVLGTSAIGGRLTSEGASVKGTVTLRRRATTNSPWIFVAATESDANGVFLFSEILSAGPGTSANAYSLVVNAPGYAAFTSGPITVPFDNVVIASPLLIPVTLYSITSPKTHAIRFSTLGDRLELDLGHSPLTRTIYVFSPNGALQHRVSVGAGESKATLPTTFSKGFVFQVR